MGNAELNQKADGHLSFEDELAAGSTLMHGQYTIERFLNAGGFGITYAAKDSLDRRVVIKECFPGAFCRRSTALVTARSRAHQSELASIVRLFVQEARSLAKLDHPNIVGVHQVFEENNTAYMALDFVEGQDLLDVIEDDSASLAPSVVDSVLRKILGAVTFVHDQGILHRDISPDNILLDSDNNPVLIDFGAAREQATKQSRVLSALRVVKDGYSPQEFYIAGSEQGPYSDLYALGATFYHLLTGDLPPNSQARLSAVASGEGDPYEPLVGRVSGYTTDFLMALDKSLEILPKDRIGSAEDWIAMMDGDYQKAAPVVSIETAKSKGAESAKPKSKKGLFLATAAAIGALAVGIATQTEVLSPSGQVQEAVSVDTLPQSAAETPVAALDDTNQAVEKVTPDVALVEETPNTPDPVPENTTVTALTETLEEPIFSTAVTSDLEAGSVQSEQASNIAMIADAISGAPFLNTEPPVAPVHVPLPERIAALASPVQQVATTLISDVEPLVSSTRLSLQERLTTLQSPVDAQFQVLASVQEPSFDETVTVTVAQDISPVETSAVPGLPRVDEAPQFAGVLTEPVTPFVPAFTFEPVQVTGIETERKIQLPYDGYFAQEQGADRIYAVNGVTVANREEFDSVVANILKTHTGAEAELQIRVGLRANAAEDQIWKLPVVYRTTLSNGLVFDAEQQDGDWVTKVADVPSELGVELETGDQVFGYLGTNELLAEPTSMSEILMREVVQGTTVFHFAVKRGTSTWAAAFPFESQTKTNSN